MNKFREADYKYIVDDLHHAFQQLCYRFGVDFDEVDGEFGITSKAHHLDGIVKKEIELQSRKDKLVVGSQWECVVDCLCSVDDNKKQRKVGLIKKGSRFKIYELIEVLGIVKIKEPLKFDIPIDQFLLCFKPKGEK